MSKRTRSWTRRQRKAIRRRTQASPDLTRMARAFGKALADMASESKVLMKAWRRARHDTDRVVAEMIKAGIAKWVVNPDGSLTIDMGMEPMKRDQEATGLPPLTFGWL